MPFMMMQGVMTLAVFAIFGVVLFRIIGQWNKNNHSPRLTVPATVIAKRGHTTRSGHGCQVCQSEVSTDYYVTFQFESGDRLELAVPNHQVGYLVEGDRGKLTFQGTRFLGFEREF